MHPRLIVVHESGFDFLKLMHLSNIEQRTSVLWPTSTDSPLEATWHLQLKLLS